MPGADAKDVVGCKQADLPNQRGRRTPGCRRRTSSWSVALFERSTRRAIYTEGNLELANELVHPDFLDHEPSHPDLPAGPESVKQTVQGLHSAFGDLRFQIEDEIADGDKVVQRVTMSGQHTGPLGNHEPTGRAFTVRHVYIWRFADHKIIEHWGSRDDLGLLHQLGLVSL